MADVNDTTSMFHGLRINAYYKYLLYLCGTIFIISLFFDVKGLNPTVVRRVSYRTIIISLITWISQDIIERYLAVKEMSLQTDHALDMDYVKTAKETVTASYVIQLIIWFLGAMWIFA